MTAFLVILAAVFPLDSPNSVTLAARVPQAVQQAAARSMTDDSLCVSMVAGQPQPVGEGMLVGQVCVEHESGTLKVHYKAASGWILTETQVAVASSLAGIPQAGAGIPLIGRFPYRVTHDHGITRFTYSIPIEEVGVGTGAEVVIAAHASVTKGGVEEGAWARGERFMQEGNPAMYVTYTIAEPE